LVSDRTLLIDVEPKLNQKAGTKCNLHRDEYRMLIPGLLQWLLPQKGWLKRLQNMVEKNSIKALEKLSGPSFNPRIAEAWALNGYGFWLFLSFSQHLGVINETDRRNMMRSHWKAISRSIRAHDAQLRAHDPVEVFLGVLGQKLEAGSAYIQDLKQQNIGEMIGKVRDEDNIVCLAVGPGLRIVKDHLSGLRRAEPYTKETLRKALVQQGLLIRSARPNRVAHQVRIRGRRNQTWQFNTAVFRQRCRITA
jgi:hypothetical protein